MNQRKEKESMWPDQVSNPGPLTYESGALPTALRGPAQNQGPTGIATLERSKIKLLGDF